MKKMLMFKRKPKNFCGMSEEEIFASQVQIVDTLGGIDLTEAEEQAMHVALNALVAIRQAMRDGGKLDWAVWEEKAAVT